MNSLLKVLITASSAVLSFFIIPFKEIKEFVFIKKEHWFKFDGNQAINQIYNFHNKGFEKLVNHNNEIIDQKLLQTLNDNKVVLNKLLESSKVNFAAIQPNVSIDVANSPTSNIFITITLSVLVIFASLSLYKYYKLKKKFFQLSELCDQTLVLLDDADKRIKADKVLLDNMNISRRDLNNLLELKKDILKKESSDHWEEAKFKLNHTLKSSYFRLNDCYIKLLSNHYTNFINNQIINEKSNLSKKTMVFYQNILKNKNHNTLKEKPFFKILAISSFITFSFLINYHLNSYGVEFKNNLLTGNYISYHSDWLLNIKDCEYLLTGDSNSNLIKYNNDAEWTSKRIIIEAEAEIIKMEDNFHQDIDKLLKKNQNYNYSLDRNNRINNLSEYDFNQSSLKKLMSF